MHTSHQPVMTVQCKLPHVNYSSFLPFSPLALLVNLFLNGNLHNCNGQIKPEGAEEQNLQKKKKKSKGGRCIVVCFHNFLRRAASSFMGWLLCGLELVEEAVHRIGWNWVSENSSDVWISGQPITAFMWDFLGKTGTSSNTMVSLEGPGQVKAGWHMLLNSLGSPATLHCRGRWGEISLAFEFCTLPYLRLSIKSIMCAHCRFSRGY